MGHLILPESIELEKNIERITGKRSNGIEPSMTHWSKYVLVLECIMLLTLTRQYNYTQNSFITLDHEQTTYLTRKHV